MKTGDEAWSKKWMNGCGIPLLGVFLGIDLLVCFGGTFVCLLFSYLALEEEKDKAEALKEIQYALGVDPYEADRIWMETQEYRMGGSK
jgi:hypothetical protein